VPDREISKNRLTFQRYLINEYVLKPQKLVKKDFDEKRGFSVIIPTKDQSGEARDSEEAKRTSKDSSGSAGYQCGDTNLTERFNVNNTELNKRRFME
jgi:hypothetical protein